MKMEQIFTLAKRHYGKLLLIFIGLVWLLYPVPMNISELIKVSRAGQSAHIDFDVSWQGEYQFALLFDVGYDMNNQEQVEKWSALFGNATESGEVIPVQLRVMKDGAVFLDERIESKQVIRSQSFYREGEDRVDAAVRDLKTMVLPAGHYSATITVLKDMPDFEAVRSLVQLIHYTPGNLAHIDMLTRITAKKFNSEWYGFVAITKWVAHGLYSLVFDTPPPIDVFKPIDVAHAGQSVRVDFDVIKDGYYDFYLLFVVVDNETRKLSDTDRWSLRDKRDRLLGTPRNTLGIVKHKGVTIPISIHLVKDGVVFFDGAIDTSGRGGTLFRNYKGEEISLAERHITGFELPRGHYAVVITTLTDTPSFDGVRCFINFGSFNPKI